MKFVEGEYLQVSYRWCKTSGSDSRGRAKVGDLMSFSVTDDQVPIYFLSPPCMRVLLTSYMKLFFSLSLSVSLSYHWSKQLILTVCLISSLKVIKVLFTRVGCAKLSCSLARAHEHVTSSNLSISGDKLPSLWVSCGSLHWFMGVSIKTSSSSASKKVELAIWDQIQSALHPRQVDLEAKSRAMNIYFLLRGCEYY